MSSLTLTDPAFAAFVASPAHPVGGRAVGVVHSAPQMVAQLGDMVGMRQKPKIAESITELIGNTPLLKLSRAVEDIPDATILAKLESMEPCSSVKEYAWLCCVHPEPDRATWWVLMSPPPSQSHRLFDDH